MPASGLCARAGRAVCLQALRCAALSVASSVVVAQAARRLATLSRDAAAERTFGAGWSAGTGEGGLVFLSAFFSAPSVVYLISDS